MTECATELLELKGICKRYHNGTLANEDVSFVVMRGEIHAIVGENGAGKSTVMKMLYGLEQPSSGSILFEGRPLRLAGPRDAIAAGIGLVPQHVQLVPSFTVAQNVCLGREPRRGLLVDRRRCADEVRALARRFGFEVDPEARVDGLSLGEQQRVEILKTLYRGARLLLLDEPSAVLPPQEAAALFAALRQLAASGLTVVLISHKLAEVRGVCDRFTVMRGGRVVGQGRAAEASDAALTELIVGRQLERLEVERKGAAGLQPLMSARRLSATDERGRILLARVSFDIAPGEILGIAGVEGNGQSVLADILAGLRAPDAGAAHLDGVGFTGAGVRVARARRVSVIPEDRLHNGVAPGMSVAENLIAADYHKPPYSRHGWIDADTVRKAAEAVIAAYQVRAQSAQVPIGSLSGGNMQKIVLAREILSGPRFLVASQPTRGVDIGAARALRRHLVGLRDSGTAILLLSADLDELLEISDRIAVLFNGQIVAHFPAGADVNELGLYMTGLRQQRDCSACLDSPYTPFEAEGGI